MSEAIRLIDAQIKQHREQAEKHERSVASYNQQAKNEQRAADLYRGLIDELESAKNILLVQAAMKPGRDV